MSTFPRMLITIWLEHSCGCYTLRQKIWVRNRLSPLVSLKNNLIYLPSTCFTGNNNTLMNFPFFLFAKIHSFISSNDLLKRIQRNMPWYKWYISSFILFLIFCSLALQKLLRLGPGTKHKTWAKVFTHTHIHHHPLTQTFGLFWGTW